MTKQLRTLLLAGLACAFLLPATAQAGNFSFGYWPGNNYNQGHGNQYNRGHGYGYGHGNNYGNRGYNNYGNGGYNNYRPSCHAVSKRSYDHYGNRVGMSRALLKS